MSAAAAGYPRAAAVPGWFEYLDDDGDVFYYNVDSGESSYALPGAPSGDAGLAPGWRQIRDRESGLPFFYNFESGESSWDRPGPPLLPGWIAIHDADSGDAYYYHEASGVSQWELPTVGGAPGDAGADGGAGAPVEEAEAMVELVAEEEDAQAAAQWAAPVIAIASRAAQAPATAERRKSLMLGACVWEKTCGYVCAMGVRPRALACPWRRRPSLFARRRAHDAPRCIACCDADSGPGASQWAQRAGRRRRARYAPRARRCRRAGGVAAG